MEIGRIKFGVEEMALALQGHEVSSFWWKLHVLRVEYFPGASPARG